MNFRSGSNPRSFPQIFTRWLVVCVVSFAAAASAVLFDTNTVISLANTNYDGMEIIISNCVVTMDGPRNFASLHVTGGGTLTHSAPTSGSITINDTVVDEPHVLVETNLVTLVQSNIYTASVVVTDETALLIYTNDVDYLLESVGGGMLALRRTETSSIPDGSTVLVTYNYLVASGTSGLDITVSGDVTVDADSAINVTGTGYGNGVGPGAGGSTGSPMSGGGGGHGGEGGPSSGGASGGVYYDSVFQPTDKGGSGGNGSGSPGGRGGGEIKMTVLGTLAINGAIRADGANATNTRSGGGAGGSIWLWSGRMTGVGMISANGGAGEPVHGGGGGGGRVALYFNTNLYSGGIVARGGSGNVAGGAGTIYSRTNSSSHSVVIVENGGVTGRKTSLSGTPGSTHLRITDGAATIFSGSLNLSSLLVGSNATMFAQSNQSLTLTVTGDATIQSGGILTGVGAGSSPGMGTGAGGTYISGVVTSGGGGAHGGNGGQGINTTASSGIAYGTISSPQTLGSGGGGRTNNVPIGGIGGGAIRLTVNGKLTVGGILNVNGTPAVHVGGGGGAGGSAWLTVGTLVGSGSITANGGNGIQPNGAGGGGGRIAIQYNTNLFTGTITAYGGSGTNNGGAGTINFYSGTFSTLSLLVDNAGLPGALTPVTSSSGISVGFPTDFTLTGGATASWAAGQGFKHLLIASNSWLFVSGTSYPSFTVSSNAIIQATGGILSDAMATAGGGTGTFGSGGSHGGYGGVASNATTAASPYGTPSSVTLAGSPGGVSGSGTAGNGGGLIRITVSTGGYLQNDGLISANGVEGSGSGVLGGGSGGGISITTPTLTGSGIIRANGGNGLNNGGGGGGGRIYISITSNLFTGEISAKGGTGYRNGGAGTIYTVTTAQTTTRTVTIDNGGLSASNTPVSFSNGENMQIRGGAGAMLPPTSQTWNSLHISSNSWLAFPSDTQVLTIASNATVEAGGAITADAAGSSPGSGSGLGGNGRGAGHGGYGGVGSNSITGGNYYGSHTQPNNPGSGGGPSQSTLVSGGRGGGRIQLTVTRELRLDGRLTANASDAFSTGTSPTPAGGGSGGSIWVTAGTISGNGRIAANGGNGAAGGGGGAGGRIAVYYNTNLFTGPITAYGGNGARGGGAGTVYIKRTGANFNGVQWIDNGGLAGTNTPLSSLSVDDAVVQGGAVAMPIGSLSLRDLQINSNGWLALNTSQSVIANNNFTVAAGGGVLADGRGNSGINNASKPGGSHGGYGGGASGPVVGSITVPTQVGTGGGGSSSIYGGGGGGLVQLTATKALTVNGVVSANGNSGDTFNGGGGGSGGSINLVAQTIAGNGTIRANGGAGTVGGGGGGGGRIALRAQTNLFTGVLSAAGGSGSTGGGAGTIYRAQTIPGQNTKPLSLTMDNNGLAGTNTPLSSVFGLPAVPFDLQIQNAAVVVPSTALPLLSNLFVNAARLELPATQPNVAVLNDAVVAPGGLITADGKGYARAAGTGAGTNVTSKGSGGGHGGVGGDSSSGAPGGMSYGSVTQPVELGSGGGNGSGTYPGGAEGGGVIRLTVGNKLTLDGRIGSDGNAALQDDAGGGAGGSVWLTAGMLEGAGLLTARGGAGELSGGGGGAGGRIALYCPSNNSTVLVLTNGGTGASPGGDGTFYYSSEIPFMQVVSQSPTGIVANAVGHVDFVFTSPFDPFSVDVSDVVVQPAIGPALSNIVFSSVNLTTLRASFPALTTNGTYNITLGPDINDLFGLPMQAAHHGSFTIELPVIQGTVTNADGSPVAGVTINPSGGMSPTVTDANGNYSLSFVPGGEFTVTPTLENFTVLPGSRGYTNLNGSISGENYLVVTTIAPTLSTGLSGTNLNLTWFGLPTVTYQLYQSTNFVDWLPYGLPFTGSNGVVEVPIPIGEDPEMFFKMEATD